MNLVELQEVENGRNDGRTKMCNLPDAAQSRGKTQFPDGPSLALAYWLVPRMESLPGIFGAKRGVKAAILIL